MKNLDVVLLVVGVLLVLLDAFAEVIRRVWLSVPLLSLAAGIVLGPELLGVVVPAELGDPMTILEGLARLALAMSVVDIALRFDRSTLRELWRPATRLVLLGMLGMWVMAGFGAWLLLDVPFWVGMLIGAILTPTDPVVAATLTSESLAEQNLPLRVRRLMQLEAGPNDGLAIVLFLLPAFILTEPAGGGVGDWLGTAAREVGISIGFGVALGGLAAVAANYSQRHKESREVLFLGVTVGVALVALAGGHLLEGSGILSAFVAGLCFALVLDEEARARLEHLHEAAANLLIPPTFAFFGMVLPFGGWSSLGIAGLAFGAWVLLLRRPPVVPLALAGSGIPVKDRAFLAWFGPIGVAAMYYTTLAVSWDLPHATTIVAAATLATVFSIVATALSAAPAVLRFAGRPATASLRAPLTPEEEVAPDAE